MRLGAALLLFLFWACAAHAQPLDVAIAHSYLSARSLGQPATLFLVGAHHEPTLSEIDASILLRGGMGTSGFWESGVRALAGSARAKSERVFGAVARGTWDLNPVGLTVAAEYEADGAFDVEKGVISAEATPEGGPRGLGRRWSAAVPLVWRPWIGAGVGNVFDASGSEDPETDSFFRAYTRLEATWSPSHWEMGAVGTLWVVESDAVTRSHARGTVAYEWAKGVSFDVTGEIGRQPPRFDYDESFKIGFGLHHPFAR
ncbi:MAG TPA: hypothetical protein VGR66_02685 [Candidatus Eisenbacteria bacterium]|nr:hypothetical protein [Candidatus Eisenbacteria bacterium]